MKRNRLKSMCLWTIERLEVCVCVCVKERRIHRITERNKKSRKRMKRNRLKSVCLCERGDN